VAALIFVRLMALSFINGRKVVEQGHLTTVELATLIEKHNQLAKQIVENSLCLTRSPN